MAALTLVEKVAQNEPRGSKIVDIYPGWAYISPGVLLQNVGYPESPRGLMTVKKPE